MDISYYEFSFRLVRFKLSSNAYEVLATNLSEDEFSVGDLKDLYHLRWGIETSFRQLKYHDCASYMHTKKKTAAIGELVLSLIFHNICKEVIAAINAKYLRSKLSQKKYYYKVSYADFAQGLRIIIAGRNPTATPYKMAKELLMTLQPVRIDRIFTRILSEHPFLQFTYRAA